MKKFTPTLFFLYILFNFSLFADKFKEDTDYGLLVESYIEVDHIDKTINLKAEPVRYRDKSCLSLKESYEKHVFEARYLIYASSRKHVDYHYRKHLKCWNDEPVFLELAKFYEDDHRYFLAGLVYKKIGREEKLKELAKKREVYLQNNNNDFKEKSMRLSMKLLKTSKVKTAVSSSMMITGAVLSLTGLGLRLYDENGGNIPKPLTFGFMIGGLSMLGSGIPLSLSSKKTYLKHVAILKNIKNYPGDKGTSPEQYYRFSGSEAEVNRISSKDWRSHGLGMLALSLPLIAVAVWGYYDSYKYLMKGYDPDSKYDTKGFEVGFFHLFQIATFAPSILLIVGGSIFIAKGEKYKYSRRKQLFSVDRVSPMINPIIRTYGISMGFSF